MASKAINLVKEKERYRKSQDNFKGLRNMFLWVFVILSILGTILVFNGAGENCIMMVLPMLGILYYIIRFHKKIKKLDLLITEVDAELDSCDEQKE